jgi:hydrogenase maturation protease
VRTVIVGIGNDFRGDDGAGLAAARLLMGLSSPEITILELNGEVTRVLDHLHEYDAAFFIDAVQSRHSPGTVHRFDASQEPLPGIHNYRSTHGISLGSLVELARTQGILPHRMIVYGIEAASFEHGASLTQEVDAAVRNTVIAVQDELKSLYPDH